MPKPKSKWPQFPKRTKRKLQCWLFYAIRNKTLQLLLLPDYLLFFQFQTILNANPITPFVSFTFLPFQNTKSPWSSRMEENWMAFFIIIYCNPFINLHPFDKTNSYQYCVAYFVIIFADPNVWDFAFKWFWCEIRLKKL